MLPNIKFAVAHGQMESNELLNIFHKFDTKEIDVLICTTIIENGIDIPNVNTLIVENAERFGLATLHQLRGRVGRNEYESTCVLIGSKVNKRLKVLEESNDGFYITEKDYEMRGEGDLFGVKQSGDMEFKVADLHTDMKILLQARDDSKEFFDNNKDNNFSSYDMYAKIIDELINLD